MKIHKIALIGSATLLTLAGMAVGACSSSSTPPATAPDGGTGSSSGASSGSSSGTASGSSSGTASGSSSGTSSGSSSGTSSGSSSGTSSGSSSGAACAKPPALHVPQPDGGVYCPYSFNDATDSGIQYCSGATPQCCVSPASDAGPSDCEAVGACANTTFNTWQCAAPSDCAGYADDAGAPLVCCLISGALEADTACPGYQKTKGLDSVTCASAASCVGPITVGKFADTHYVACEQQADCTASGGADGGTCTPVFAVGTSIGLCL